MPTRRGFLKGLAALGGLTLAGPLCLLEDAPKLFTVAKPEVVLASVGEYGQYVLYTHPDVVYDLESDAAVVGYEQWDPLPLRNSYVLTTFDKRLLKRFRQSLLLRDFVTA